MRTQSVLACILGLALVLAPTAASAQTFLQRSALAPIASGARFETLAGNLSSASGWPATVQEQIQQSEYDFTWQQQTYLPDLAAAYQAPNRSHNLRTYFTSEGIRVIPRVFVSKSPPWQWELSLQGYGYEDNVQPVNEPTSLAIMRNRIDYESAGVKVWCINTEHGLEQGYTLQAPPKATSKQQRGKVVLESALGGDLTPLSTGEKIGFGSTEGNRVLGYGGLVAVDARQRSLPARMELTAFATNMVRLEIDTAGAAYPITVSTFVTTFDWMAESDQEFASFGYAVGTAGDVNGDGYDDVIIGAPWYDNGQIEEGRAYVYLGAAAGLAPTPAWWAEGNQDNAYFGRSVSAAGDINGDGYADVIVGDEYYDNGQADAGRAFVYYGGASGLSADADWTAESDQENAHFGVAVGVAGDVNGDGYSDVIVGALGYNDGQAQGGRAFIYHGGASGLSANPAQTVAINQAGAAFGYSVATAGDVNGDGYDDIIVGAPGYDHGQDGEGGAFVYYGSAGGLDPVVAWTAEGDQANAWFGGSVGSAGDVNGDGYADVVAGAHLYSNGQAYEGKAFVYQGSATGLSSVAGWAGESNQDDAGYGYVVGTAGDVNGDGYSDVVIGAPFFDDGQTNEGGIYVYEGTASGLNTAAAWTAESDMTGDWMSAANYGFSAGTAGDVNGDGYDDVIAGASGYNDGITFKGRAFVYFGWGIEEPPVAGAGPEQSVATLAVVTLDGSGSSDPDADLPLTYAWTQSAGPTVVLNSSAIVSPTFTAPNDPAVLTFSLAVTDSRGIPALASSLVTVTVVNQPPLADAGPDVTATTLTTVTLDGSGSSDPDGDLPLLHGWTQNGGPAVTLNSSTAVSPTFTAPANSAVLTFTLAVTDSLDLAMLYPDTIVVTVTRPYREYVYLPVLSRR